MANWVLFDLARNTLPQAKILINLDVIQSIKQGHPDYPGSVQVGDALVKGTLFDLSLLTSAKVYG